MTVVGSSGGPDPNLARSLSAKKPTLARATFRPESICAAEPARDRSGTWAAGTHSCPSLAERRGGLDGPLLGPSPRAHQSWAKVRLSAGFVRFTPSTRRGAEGLVSSLLSSHAEEFHLRVLLEPYVNLSAHSAPDVRPFP